MIRTRRAALAQSVKRFSEEIMLKQRALLFGRADGGKSAAGDQAGRIT
jgi:hypothetical protein